MPDALGKPSEFGGKVGRNRVQPSPHIPTQSERMMLLYTTGDESGTSTPDGGEAFAGLIPLGRQIAKRKAEGVFDKGQVWDALKTEADPLITELVVPDA